MISLSTINEENPSRQREENDRDDDGSDGAPERRRVQWDGSRAEIVADEAEEFEEQHTGVQISYSLSESEIYSFLKGEKQKKKIYVLETAFYAVLSVIFFILSTGPAARGMLRPLDVLLGLCAAVLFCVRLTRPVFACRRAARAGASGNDIRMTIYPDHIHISREKEEWRVPLDGSYEHIVTDSVIALRAPDEGTRVDEETARFPRTLLLPLRCIDPAVLPEVQAMIFAGTKPGRRR